MTRYRKFLTAVAPTNGLPRFMISFLQMMGLLLSACTTTAQNSGTTRSQEQKDEIRNLVQASKIIECKLSSADWTIPGDVGQAQMIKSEGHWALIYEALLRSGPRTVYQPLQANFSFNGDGIAMGLRGSPNVSDLKTFEDANQHRWFVSRVKMNNSELYSGLIEVLVNGKNFRSVLPIPAGESIQQIWPSQPAVSGFLNVVVRSTSADDATTGQDDESTFRWYQVGSTENSARLIMSYKPKNESIQPAGFVALEKSAEPVAVTIVQSKLESADANPRTGDTTTKIALKRIFSRTPTERIVFSGKGIFSSLNVSDSTPGASILLAWIFSPAQGGNRFLQSISFPVKFIPERFFNKPSVKDFENLIATELFYDAANPDFSFTINNQNQHIPVLSWWAKLENDVALMVQVITPLFRQAKSKLLKTGDGLAVGTQFQPSLVIIPPKQFNRIMFFTAAPTQTEKSIIILSNRSDSAEISKESSLYSCLF